MSSNNPNTQAQYYASYVAERLSNGAPKDQLVKGLVQNGMTPEEAVQFIDYVEDVQRRERRRRDGMSTSIFGIILAAVGGGIYLATNYFFTFPGGVAVLPWGLIAWGGWQMFKGLNVVLDNQQPKQPRL